MPERGLRQRIRAALRRAFPGALVLQWPSNLWTGAGWPDLLFSQWPLLVGFEVKQGRYSHPTPLQASRHVELRKHFIPVFVTYDPDGAVDIINTLKEKLPMAFDPALLAELEAALNEQPAEQPEPLQRTAAPAYPAEEASIQDQATADQNVADLANGTAVFEEVKLDPDLPAPDIEDLTAMLQANAAVAESQADEALEIERTLLGVLLSLKDSIDALSTNVTALLDELRADKSDEAPAPRRRTRRS